METAGPGPEEARRRLERGATDFATLEVWLRDLGVDRLLDRLAGPESPFSYWYSEVQPVRRALLRGRSLLAADDTSLATVLTRYLWGDEPAITRLRAAAAARSPTVVPGSAMRTRRPVSAIEHGHRWIEAILALPSGRRVVTVADDGGLAVSDLASGRVTQGKAGQPFGIVSAACALDGTVYTGDEGGTVLRWRVSEQDGIEGPEQAFSLPREAGFRPDSRVASAVLALAPLPGRGHLLAGSADGTVQLWRLDPARLVWAGHHTAPVNAIAISADGQLALSGSDDATVRVWDLPGRQEAATLRGHTRSVRGVAVTADGRRLVSVSADRTLRVWEGGRCVSVLGGGGLPGDPVPELGPPLPDLVGHWRAIETVALSVDGRYAVTGSADHTLWLWDLDEQRAVAVLEGHTGPLRSVAMCGQWIVSGGHDPHLLVWDAQVPGNDPGPGLPR